MRAFENLVHTPLAAALGWTLFHSLWEGVAVAVALAVVLCLSRSSRTRYAFAYGAMLVILVSAAITLIRMMPTPSRAFMTPVALPALVPVVVRGSIAAPRHLEMAEIVPWLAPLWIAGVIVFYLRCAASWAGARRLRSTGVCIAPESWQQRMQQLAGLLGVTKAVALLESSLASAPAVIGFARPVILTPVGMLAGMPVSHIESILLHELAHVRRNDYLANLLQTAVEGLLFYHPAIWWISHVIRTERENCCDDLVVEANGNAHEYATALSALAETRMAAIALPATGGSLMKRIRRLLQPEQSSPSFLMPLLSAVVFTLLTAWAASAWQTQAARAPKAAPDISTPAPLPATKPEPLLIAQVQVPPLPAEPAPVAIAKSPETKMMEMFVNGERRVYRAEGHTLSNGRTMWVIDERHPLIAQAQAPVLVMPGPPRADQEAALRNGLETPWQKWLNEDVVYIITAEERQAFRQLQTDAEREQFIQQFWLRRDPTPGTPTNEMQEEHYRRIDYVNNRFVEGAVPGWKTDRGRIYISFGPPDELESHPAGGDGKPPYEVWHYRFITGIGSDVFMEFDDTARSGEYHMTMDPNGTRVQRPPDPLAPVTPRFRRDTGEAIPRP